MTMSKDYFTAFLSFIITGETHSSWQLVLSHLGFASVLLLRSYISLNHDTSLALHFTKFNIFTAYRWTFATGPECQQGTLTPPDTWYRTIWGFHMFFSYSDQPLFQTCTFTGQCTPSFSRYFLDFVYRCFTDPFIWYHFCKWCSIIPE